MTEARRMTDVLSFWQPADILSGFGSQTDGARVSFVFAQFAIEGAGRDAKNRRGAFAISFAFVQHAEDVFAL